MFRSATLKLTLWYVLLSVALSLLFSVVLYQFTTQELAEGLQQQYQTLSANDHDVDNRYSLSREVDRHTHRLFSELVYFNIAVVIGSTVISYILARRTLWPIERAHQAQLRFTAEASHELRTPLAAMRADTEVALMEKGLNAKARRTLKGNVVDIQKLETLATHLLDISRYQNAATDKFELLNLDEIINQSLQQFKQTVKNKQLKVVQNIHPAQILGDNYGLQQLITIVLDNAVKYSHRGGKITIKLDSLNKYAVLTISDTGIGIPADDVPNLFERFYRAGNAELSQSRASGYGLGLPLAQEIATAHKGAIQISSQEKQGSTVTIKLPLNKA